jgi:hypothetical protein
MNIINFNSHFLYIIKKELNDKLYNHLHEELYNLLYLNNNELEIFL